MLPVAILAGGLATRLRPLTETIPKALVEICGEPFLGHQLRLLSRAGITHAVLCLGYRADQIREFAGDGRAFGLHLDYSHDGPALLGTAGALKKALPFLGDSFFVLYGDSYLPCDYAAVEQAFRESRKSGLMTIYRNESRWDWSNVEFSEGRIRAYDKANRTPAMNYIDYGLGVFRRDPFDALPENLPADLAALYQDLLRRGDLACHEVNNRFYEIGSPDGIRELEEFLSR
ncbi:MAG TPA: nucleotidyltransferase family protein [Bryobacteraceae bacterium]|nr:nucleotidyltransferase family protein [Bryobacteraceae bacterium]